MASALSRATSHLTVTHPDHAELTIECGVERDIAQRVPTSWPPHGTSHADDGSTVISWDGPAGPLCIYDRENRQARTVFRSLEDVSAWERAAPFRRILHWWAADRGLRLVHAAAVGGASGGALLVGRSGSGKSTTALACLDAGLGFAGDDYCLIEPGEPPQVHGLYLSAKADAKAALLLRGLRAALTDSPLQTEGKSVVFADGVRPEAVRTGFPLHGIIVPRLAGGSTGRLTPLSPAAALLALAPSTLLQMPGQRADGLARLAAIVRHLPAWELTLGSPADAAGLIADLLGQEAAR